MFQRNPRIAKDDLERASGPGRPSSEEFFEDDVLSDEDAARAALRTILITALAGALTAATVLVGWGLQISADEIGRRRAEGLARGSEAGAFFEVSYFAREEAAGGGGEFRVDLRADFGGEFAGRSARTVQLAEMQMATSRASDYARKRDRLAGLLARLKELAADRVEGAGAAGDIQARAAYRALLVQADALRGELNKMREDEEQGQGVVLDEAQERRETGLSEAIAVEVGFASADGESGQSTFDDSQTAGAHCRRLLADLESNRLRTIASLAFVDEAGEFPD